jgi:hypothetical protein
VKTLALLLGLAVSAWTLPIAFGDDTPPPPATAPAAAPAPGPAPTLYPVDDLQETPLYKVVAMSEGEMLGMGVSKGLNLVHPGHFRRFGLVNVLTGEQREVFSFDPKDPKQSEVLQAIQGAGPGAPLVISTQRDVKRDIISNIAPYTIRDGEDRPNTFLFVANLPANAEKGPNAAIKLYKFGHFVLVHVPTSVVATGHAPDPLAEAIGRLQPGQMVEVETSGSSAAPTLRKISALPPLQSGTLAKSGLEDIDGVKIPGVHITVGGEDRIFLVPGKKAGKDRWTTDSRVAIAVRTCKPLSAVSFRAYEENGHWWLREIATAKASVFNK